MKLSKVLVALAAVLIPGLLFACQKQMRPGPDATIARYIAAYNAHDKAALRAVVAQEAHYTGAVSGQTRPLIEQNLESWSLPATADARLASGKLEGRDVIVVWTQPHLPDGTTAPWTPGAYLSVDVSADRIAGVRGTMILNDPGMQTKVIGVPPE